MNDIPAPQGQAYYSVKAIPKTQSKEDEEAALCLFIRF